MSFFHSDEYENIKALRDQAKAERADAVNKIQQVSDDLNGLYEDVAQGKASAKDADRLEKALQAAKVRLQETDEKLQRIEAIRRKKGIELIPIVGDLLKKIITDKLQKKHDEKLQEHYKIRNAFLRSLAELGEIGREADVYNHEYNELMQEFGGKQNPYGKHVKTTPVITNGWNPEEICKGIREETQEDAYNGNLPEWAKDKKEGD